MKIAPHQLDSFGHMLEDFAIKHKLNVYHAEDPRNKNRYRIRFDDLRSGRWGEHIVILDEVRSLTDAATQIFVSTMLEFGLRNNDETAEYCRNDIAATQAIYDKLHPFEPVRVIFNDPATIVFWRDGSKTVVKCQPGETFNEMVGLAMAISKKALGNKGNYNEVFKKHVPGYGVEKDVESDYPFVDYIRRNIDDLERGLEYLKKHATRRFTVEET